LRNDDMIAMEERKAIFAKIDKMAMETGEHPFIFKNDGIPVLVSFPVEAEDYFTPQEIQKAEKLLMESESKQAIPTQEPNSLSQRISNAREKAEDTNKSIPAKEQTRKIDDKQI